MHELMIQINQIERDEAILNRDLDILANCYISRTMNPHLRLPIDNDVSYNHLLDRFVKRIQMQNRNVHIDMNNVMTYLDYYYGV